MCSGRMVLELLIDADIHVERKEAIGLVADVGKRVVA